MATCMNDLRVSQYMNIIIDVDSIMVRSSKAIHLNAMIVVEPPNRM